VFWATVCKNSLPYAIRPLSVCHVLFVMSVTLVYCGQTVGQIKMKLGMQLGHGPGNVVLHGNPAPLPIGAQPPIFGPYLLRPIGWMSLAIEIGLGPGDFLLEGEPAAPPQKGGGVPLPIFGPCPLWPNCWMDQDGTWHGGRPWCRPHRARWRPSSPPQKGGVVPNFRHMSIVAKRLDGSRCHLVRW